MGAFWGVRVDVLKILFGWDMTLRQCVIGFDVSRPRNVVLFLKGREFQYLLTPWSRVLFEKRTSKLCS